MNNVPFWLWAVKRLKTKSEVENISYGSVWENAGGNNTMMIQSGVTEVCALPSAVALYNVFKTMTFFIFYNSVQNEPILIIFWYTAS